MALVAAALVAGVLACSPDTAGRETSTAVTSPSAAPASHANRVDDDRRAFSECMVSNGVPAPPPSGPADSEGPPPIQQVHRAPPPPPEVDRDVWDRAIDACRSLAPAPPHHLH